MCEDVAVVAWPQLTSAQFKPLAVTQFPLLTSFSTEISLSPRQCPLILRARPPSLLVRLNTSDVQVAAFASHASYLTRLLALLSKVVWTKR